MNIFKVVGTMVCTHRHPGLKNLPLRVLQDTKGKYQVAVDTVGSQEGNVVFVISGSAARLALNDNTVLTDLTIGGIFDEFEQQEIVGL